MRLRIYFFPCENIRDSFFYFRRFTGEREVGVGKRRGAKRKEISTGRNKTGKKINCVFVGHESENSSMLECTYIRVEPEKYESIQSKAVCKNKHVSFFSRF